MSKNYLAFFIMFFVMQEVINAKAVECRVITGGTSSCSPYSSKLLRAKEIKYELNRNKLIVSKTLPVPEKKSSVKVISVEDMIEKYVKVEDSMRFKGNEPVLPEKIEKEIIITRIEKIKLERKKLFDKMKKAKEEKEKKRLEAERIAEEEKRLEVLELAEKEQKKALENEETKKLEAIKLAEEEKIKELEEKRKKQGLYVIEKGDSLSTIAAKFKIKTKKLRALNNLGKKSSIQIGKKLIIPYDQKRIDAIARGEYIVEEGDTLSSIAEDFNLTTKEIMKYNKLKKDSTICLGKKILLPLPHKLAKVKKKRSKTKLIRKFGKKKFRKHFGKRKLRVTATAYSSHGKQTDKTPFLAAWNNRLHPGMKVIAVSRDMLTKYGMRNGTKVRIAGLPGVYRVRDKMNKRYRKRIDIYMGMNRRKALRWGRRSVVVYW